MNSVILIGRLTRDPELRYTPNSNTAIAHFTLAVDRPPQQGQQDRQADFIRITVFGRQAETCSRYLNKGRQIAVHGRIQTGSYRNKDGQTVYTTDVVADRVEFLGSGNGGNNAGNGGYGGNNYGNANNYGGNNNYGGGYNGGNNSGNYNGGNGGSSNGGGSYNGNSGGAEYNEPANGSANFAAEDTFGPMDDQDFPDAFQATDDDIPF